MTKSKKFPKVSVVIPLYVISDRFFSDFEHFQKLDYPDFELLVVCDKKVVLPKLKSVDVKLILTKKKQTGPAEKRDIALSKTRGEYLAFLDDDSYPDKNWLKNAVDVIKQENTVAVCGPGLTPPRDSWSQKISGAILTSRFGSGPYKYRFDSDTPRFIDDYPAYNMIISRKVLEEVGGFGTKFYGGEDTALCIKIINVGYKILYHPSIVVYHHRRKFPFEFAKQIGNVGLHRGYFAKNYPQTSLRLSYFMPSLMLVGGLFLVAMFFINGMFGAILVATTALGYLTVFVEGMKKNSFLINTILPLAIFITHVVYGVNFIKGFLFTENLST